MQLKLIKGALNFKKSSFASVKLRIYPEQTVNTHMLTTLNICGTALEKMKIIYSYLKIIIFTALIKQAVYICRGRQWKLMSMGQF